MSTAPSNSAPKTPEQFLKPMSPPKKSDSLKQTMLELSVAMAKGKSQENRGFPESKGKELKRPTLKVGPSRDTTIADSVEHLIEDISLSSDKELWVFVRRKRQHPTKGNGNGRKQWSMRAHLPKKTSHGRGSCCCLEQGL